MRASTDTSGAAPGARLLVIAKEPVPGHVKTRLTPPFAPASAARLARAALEDTLDTVLDAVDLLGAAGLVTEPVLVLSGRSWPGVDPRFRLVPQRGDGLDERLAAAFADAAGSATESVPTVLIGMDTPQASAEVLVEALRVLADAEAEQDACLGAAADGGWWLLGLRRPDPTLLLGLPMSQPVTGAATAARLEEAGCRVLPMPVLRDVDTAADAAVVAEQVPPGSRFAAVHAELRRFAS